MNPTRIRQIIGGITVAGGMALIGSGVYFFISTCASWWHRTPAPSFSGIELIGLVGILLLASVFLIPGYCGVVYGCQLFREMRISSVRWVVGLWSTGAAFLIGNAIYQPAPSVSPGPARVETMASPLGNSLLAVIFYLTALRLLLPRLGVPQPMLSSLISRGTLVILAWELWFVLNAVADSYFGLPGDRLHDSYLWDLTKAFGPVVIAYGIFRLAASRLSPPMPDPFVAEPAWKTGGQ